jgi:hypothetical protein
MNWLLIAVLSGFGLAMGIGTVSLIPSSVEPAFWLVIFAICAYVIARRAPGRFFLHCVAVSLVNSVWITGFHQAFFDTYLAHHAQEAAMTASMPLSDHPRLLMAVVGPIIGAATGLVLGIFSVVAARMTRRRTR